jgi:hypothetical protein
MSDDSFSTLAEDQRILSLAKANNQLFGRSQFRTKITSSSRPQLRIHPYHQSETRAVSPLIISRSLLDDSSNPVVNQTEQDYHDMEYVSPPSSPARSPTPPLWTPPPELSWGSDEDEDNSNTDCKFYNFRCNLNVKLTFFIF